MLDVEITGDSHPKTVVVISDDANGENAALVDGLQEFWPDLALMFENAPFENGQLRVKLEPEVIGDFMDFLDADFYDTPAREKLEAMRDEAHAEVEAKLNG